MEEKVKYIRQLPQHEPKLIQRSDPVTLSTTNKLLFCEVLIDVEIISPIFVRGLATGKDRDFESHVEHCCGPFLGKAKDKREAILKELTQSTPPRFE